MIKIVPSNDKFDKEEKTEKGFPYKEYSNVDLAELKLFLYTVVWRLGLAQELNYGVKIFSDSQYEKLRTIINKFLSEDISDITANEEILNELPLTILTSNFPNLTMNVYAPHRVINNPPLFIACKYLIFIHFNDQINPNPNFNLPLEVFNPILINKNNLPVKIGFLLDKEWEQFLKREYVFKAKEFQNIRIKSLSEKSGKSYKECGHLIHSKTYKLQIHQLMKKLRKSRRECYKLYGQHGEKIIMDNHLNGYGFSFHIVYSKLMEELS